jgi:hypothetical protein
VGFAVTLKCETRRAAELLKEGAIQPLDGFLDRARALHAGRVIEVELETNRSRYFYAVPRVGG